MTPDEAREWARLLISDDRMSERQRVNLAAALLTMDEHGVVTDGRCDQSTWRGTSHRPYGPGEFNRCVSNSGHPGRHRDEWGHVWETGGRVIRMAGRL